LKRIEVSSLRSRSRSRLRGSTASKSELWGWLEGQEEHRRRMASEAKPGPSRRLRGARQGWQASGAAHAFAEQGQTGEGLAAGTMQLHTRLGAHLSTAPPGPERLRQQSIVRWLHGEALLRTNRFAVKKFVPFAHGATPRKARGHAKVQARGFVRKERQVWHVR